MEFLEIKDEKKYNQFVRGMKHAEFLQAWQWGKFQEQSGNKIIRVGVEENGELRAVVTLIKKNIGLGKSYFFSPRGPVIDYKTVCGKDASECKFENTFSIEVANILFTGIKKLAKKEKVVFYRFEPICSGSVCSFATKSAIDIEPKETAILNLSLSEDELLKTMHQKTRYNIRLAEKKGVEVRELETEKGIDDFWKLMTVTGNRDSFRIHPREHYEKMLSQGKDFIRLFVAERNGRILSTGIFSFFGDTATYIHGASSNEERGAMAPYLLQWELIKTAKNAGCKYYDFYGIDEKKWPGVTRFKIGFRGEKKNYPGTFDIVFNKIIYKLYQGLRDLRRFLGKKK